MNKPCLKGSWSCTTGILTAHFKIQLVFTPFFKSHSGYMRCHSSLLYHPSYSTTQLFLGYHDLSQLKLWTLLLLIKFWLQYITLFGTSEHPIHWWSEECLPVVSIIQSFHVPTQTFSEGNIGISIAWSSCTTLSQLKKIVRISDKIY